MIEKKYKNIISKLKSREVDINIMYNFSSPEHLQLLTNAIRNIEKRVSQEFKYSNKDYNLILERFSKNKDFNKNVDAYLADKDRFCKPQLTYMFKRNDLEVKYSWAFLDVAELKEKKNYKHLTDRNHRIKREFYNKNKLGLSLSFIKKFDDFEKFKYIVKELNRVIKTYKIDVSLEASESFIDFYYSDEDFNFYYNLFLKTQDRNILPSLVLKNGGDISRESFLVVTTFERRIRKDLTEKELRFIKKHIDLYLI